jgi:hypothetical protein
MKEIKTLAQRHNEELNNRKQALAHAKETTQDLEKQLSTVQSQLDLIGSDSARTQQQIEDIGQNNGVNALPATETLIRALPAISNKRKLSSMENTEHTASAGNKDNKHSPNFFKGSSDGSAAKQLTLKA